MGAPGTTQTGISGSPSGSLQGGTAGKSSISALFEKHSSSGGDYVFTTGVLGFAGSEFTVYIVGAFFAGIYAWFYKMKVVEQIQPLGPLAPSGEDDFKPGICECWLDACNCVHLILPCCAYVRQAHTNEVTGICAFWPTFWLYIIGGLCCGLAPAV